MDWEQQEEAMRAKGRVKVDTLQWQRQRQDLTGVGGEIAGLVVEDYSTRLAMGVAHEGVSHKDIGGASEVKLNEFALVVFSLKHRREPAVRMWSNRAIAVEWYKRTRLQWNRMVALHIAVGAVFKQIRYRGNRACWQG
ncbi:hypothetical protein BC835DRAFT_1308284 [Cytidiella melzeri]|nr:hypothetical protein BC835DRAFT_1308284 [Cytidiella melzeri]